MTAWTAFDTIAFSLGVIAGCSVVALLKSFGLWRWLGPAAKRQWITARVWWLVRRDTRRPKRTRRRR